MKRLKAHTLRTLSITLILLLVAIGYITKIGLGNLSGAGIDVVSLLCPLGALSTMLAAKLVIPPRGHLSGSGFDYDSSVRAYILCLDLPHASDPALVPRSIREG